MSARSRSLASRLGCAVIIVHCVLGSGRGLRLARSCEVRDCPHVLRVNTVAVVAGANSVSGLYGPHDEGCR